MTRTRPIVAIDGPSGAGKSTVSRNVAEALGYVHVDTGALYRAVALAATRAGVAFDDDGALEKLVAEIDLRLKPSQQGTRVFLGGEDVSKAIRTPEISMGASAVSARAPVRAGLLELQRRLGGAGGSVLEGRDIGTVVFPDAEVKVFLTATEEERARRRYAELTTQGVATTLEQVLAEIRKRDEADSSRALAPLKQAPDATRLDSTKLSMEAVVEQIVEMARNAEA